MADQDFATKYPLHTLMKAEEERRAVVQKVLDWLDEQGWTICRWAGDEGGDIGVGPCHEYVPIHESKPDLIGKFFGVDPQAFDAEKRAMLDAIRETGDV